MNHIICIQKDVGHWVSVLSPYVQHQKTSDWLLFLLLCSSVLVLARTMKLLFTWNLSHRAWGGHFVRVSGVNDEDKSKSTSSPFSSFSLSFSHSLSLTHTFCALLFTMTHAVGLQAIIKASCHSDHITESLGVCGVCSWCNITVCVCVCGEQFHLHRCTTDVLLAYAVSPITAFWHNIFTAHTNLHTNTPTCSQERWVCVGGQSSVLWF